MGYDYGLKEIARLTGLTGVESKHIVQSFRKQNIDYRVVDWKTLGEDARDFGKRTDIVWSKLGSMYGISRPMTRSNIKQEITKTIEIQRGIPSEVKTFGVQKEMCIMKHLKRTDKSIKMDDIKKAKKRFTVNNSRGVQLWMKNPNRFDIVGVDYIPKNRRR